MATSSNTDPTPAPVPPPVGAAPRPRRGRLRRGLHTDAGDGVATLLGGNAPGTNERATLIERLQALPDLGYNIVGDKYGEKPSAHSTYLCRANCGNDASLTPEQLEIQEAP